MINSISPIAAIGGSNHFNIVEPRTPRAAPPDPSTRPKAAAAPLPVVLLTAGEIVQESQQLQQALRILWALG